MICPSCKNDVTPERGDPSIGRAEFKDGQTKINVSVESLCPVCGQELISGKTNLVRNELEHPEVIEHTVQGHELGVEVLRYSQLPPDEDTGLPVVSVSYMIVCRSCDKQPDIKESFRQVIEDVTAHLDG